MNNLLDLVVSCLVRGMHFSFWTLTVLTLHHPFTVSVLVSKPMNTVSIVGNRTKIECSRNPNLSYPVDWEFASAGSNDFSYIYASRRITETVSSRYRIETDNRTRYDIVIDSVDLSHAGTYRCKPITEDPIRASAELTVLASYPVCNTNASVLSDYVAEHEYIRMWCTVNYSGNWIPVMEWTRSIGQTVDSDITDTSTTFKATLSLIRQLNSSDNGATFTCKMSFKPPTKMIKNPRTDNTLATNFPQHHYLWNFKANVSFAPRDLTILPMNGDYRVGDRLACSARGNPDPSYEWMEVDTNVTIHGSHLTIDDNMSSDKTHIVICKAYNTVNGSMKQTSKTVTFTVTIPGKSGLRTEQYVIISIIVVGAVCCLVLALHLCNNRCPYKRGIARPDPDILQAVQINPYHSDPANQLRQIDSLGFQDRNSQQQLPIPVYAEVRRKENIADGATGYMSKQKGLPVYTEVTKNRNGSKHPDWPGQTAESIASQHRSPKTHPGVDGTQYMDVSSMRDLNARAPIRHPPMFSLVETYASIDHTVNAPPPLLPPKRQ